MKCAGYKNYQNGRAPRDPSEAQLGAMEPLKILVFSGDNDAVCGTQGTLTWIFSLGLNVTDYWKGWRFNDPLYGERLGGYYTKMDGIHFATVHGAGHEVPAYKPAVRVHLFHPPTHPRTHSNVIGRTPFLLDVRLLCLQSHPSTKRILLSFFLSFFLLPISSALYLLSLLVVVACWINWSTFKLSNSLQTS